MIRESRWRMYLLVVMVFHSYVRLEKGTYFCCMILPVYWYRYVRSTSSPGSVHVWATLHACAACIWICIYIYTHLYLSLCSKYNIVIYHNIVPSNEHGISPIHICTQTAFETRICIYLFMCNNTSAHVHPRVCIQDLLTVCLCKQQRKYEK